MLGFLRIKLGIQRIFGIPFTSLLLFRLFVPWFLRAFPLMCYNQIGQQCVVPTGWSSQKSLFVVFVVQFLVFSFYCCCLVLSLVGGFFILLLYFFILLIYLFVVSYQKINLMIEGIINLMIEGINFLTKYIHTDLFPNNQAMTTIQFNTVYLEWWFEWSIHVQAGPFFLRQMTGRAILVGLCRSLYLGGSLYEQFLVVRQEGTVVAYRWEFKIQLLP